LAWIGGLIGSVFEIGRPNKQPTSPEPIVKALWEIALLPGGAFAFFPGFRNTVDDCTLMTSDELQKN
jgi:hypothetical protein